MGNQIEESMSSNHYVKDGQEPPLVIEAYIDEEIIGGLLEWSPYTLVWQEATEKYLSTGSKMDGLIVEANRAEEYSTLIAAQQPVFELKVDTVDDIPAQLARWCQIQSISLVTICTDRGEFWRNALINKPLNAVIIDNNAVKWHRLPAGENHKWFRSGILQFDPPTSVLVHSKPVIGTFEHPDNDFLVLDSPTPFWIGEKLY